MRTRTRAKNEGEAEESTPGVPVIEDPGDNKVVQPTPTSSSAIDSAAAPGTAKKRKRSATTKASKATKKQAVKGEWVLPHGMGDTPTDGKDEAVDDTSITSDIPDTSAPRASPKKSTSSSPEIGDPDKKMRIKRGESNKYGLTPGYSPYLHRTVPAPAECEEVHKVLTDLHGEVKQPARAPAPSLTVAGCGEVPSVLDALLRTVISANTKMELANKAIRDLVAKYGTIEEGIGAGSINWDAVRLAPRDELEETIKSAGCKSVKGGHIKTILNMVYEDGLARAEAFVKESNAGQTADVAGAERPTKSEKAKEVANTMANVLSLDHMHGMTKDEAMKEFLKFPGIGVKTAACVILFCLRIPCYAVDTHVHKFSIWLGWVPEKANELDTFNHGEVTVPDHLKYGLHQLFIRHGQTCYKCMKSSRAGSDAWNEAADCPLEHLLERTRGNLQGKMRSDGKKTGKDAEAEGEEENTEVVDIDATADISADPTMTKVADIKMEEKGAHISAAVADTGVESSQDNDPEKRAGIAEDWSDAGTLDQSSV